jgi:hypothetical protein
MTAKDPKQFDHVVFVLGENGIDVHEDFKGRNRHGDPGGAPAGKVWVQGGGTIVFMFENTTETKQVVRIPPAEIVPSPKFGSTARPFPLARGQHTIEVPAARGNEPGEATMELTVNPVHYFFFDSISAAGMTYKYTIYTDKHFLDPDLEINP